LKTALSGFIPANAPGLEVGATPQKAVFSFRSTLNANGKVKGPAPDQPGIKIQCLALTPAMILFIALPSSEEKTDPG
jgi:hypothetical protein